jgi:hypothetical protein
MAGEEVVAFCARAKVTLNGRKQILTGQGKIDDDGGVVDGRYIHDLPANENRVDALIFQTVLVTGYPSVCRADALIQNPFRHGDYNYRRQIDFGRHGKMAYHANCWLVRERSHLRLHSEFVVEGELDLPRLESALPLIEHWIPNERTIESSFEINWPMIGSTGHVIGKASTEYRPPVGSAKLTGLTTRNIVFEHACSTGTRLEIVQKSWLS